MVQRYRDGKVLVLADDVRKTFVFLNAAVARVIIGYWMLLFVFLCLHEWIGSWPLAARILVPLVLTLATFGSARLAATYTKRMRGPEDIDTRRYIWRGALFPVMLPPLIFADQLTAPFHWTGFAGYSAIFVVVTTCCLILGSDGAIPDIGDFTFKEARSTAGPSTSSG